MDSSETWWLHDIRMYWADLVARYEAQEASEKAGDTGGAEASARSGMSVGRRDGAQRGPSESRAEA